MRVRAPPDVPRAVLMGAPTAARGCRGRTTADAAAYAADVACAVAACAALFPSRFAHAIVVLRTRSLAGVATNNFALDELVEVEAPKAKAKAKAKAE